MRRPGRETWRPASHLGSPPALLETQVEPPARARRLPDSGEGHWERAAILVRTAVRQSEVGRGKRTTHHRVAGEYR